MASRSDQAILLLVASALAGSGHGLAFLAAQHELNRLAPPEHRGEVSAAFYTCIYLGVAIPVIGVGVLADATSLVAAVGMFSAVIGSTAVMVGAWHLRHRSLAD